MDESKTRLSDIATLRRNASEHLENGAVTTDDRADRKQVLRLAKGIHAGVAAAEFLEHSNQEAGHADDLAALLDGIRS
jgi:bacterioferritin